MGFAFVLAALGFICAIRAHVRIDNLEEKLAGQSARKET